MNILIILEKERQESDVESKHGVLLEHAKHWVLQGNTVYVFGIKTPDKWKDSGFRFVRSPGIIPNNLRAYLWFLSGSHPRVDLVIESVGLLNLMFKKTTTVFYFSDRNLKSAKSKSIIRSLTGKLITYVFSKFYRNQHFLFSSFWKLDSFSYSTSDLTKMFLLKKGLPENLPKDASRIKKGGKTILFASKKQNIKEYQLAIDIFKGIDRRSEASRFTILTNGKVLKKVKELALKQDFNNNIGVWAYESQKVLIREVLRSDFMLDTEASEETVYTDIQALYLRTLVFVEGSSKLLQKFLGFEKVVTTFDKGKTREVAQEILKLASDSKKKEKRVNGGIAFASNYSWKKLTQNSLKFLENI